MAIKKIRMRPESTNNYEDVLHPETSAEQVKLTSSNFVATNIKAAVEELLGKFIDKFDKSGGSFTGIVKSFPNTSNTTAQVRNITLSPNNANVNSMGEGEIWIKYE